ncbi:putative amastin-like protein [Leishmania mexicana MHOM/GT/2001/U1103]|uniref:Amastin-like protein n=1 Tax=Leishmania mexicana (strain MHOM/GT/2001/U1103) TaxID=929439 RepID=E9AMF5_LEIMU|nr:putative amastin-like protein [Leishmania mexicana MHOM/GT/2001/U1103]CBZ24110.1 putative amastin-like protein [Leishmania mexicana MHOM/GT/2001/U1103]
MAVKLGVIVYVVLQLIAFVLLMIGTGVDMFYIKPDFSFGWRVCVTLWGGKDDCRKPKITITSDFQWALCPRLRDNFRAAEAFAIISIFVYGFAFLFGFLLLYFCALFRWVCLTLNIVGAVTAGVVWVLMVVTYRIKDPKCEKLSIAYNFGTGFGLILCAWVLDILDLIFLLVPWQLGESGESEESKEYTEEMEEEESMPEEEEYKEME